MYRQCRQVERLVDRYRCSECGFPAQAALQGGPLNLFNQQCLTGVKKKLHPEARTFRPEHEVKQPLI